MRLVRIEHFGEIKNGGLSPLMLLFLSLIGGLLLLLVMFLGLGLLILRTAFRLITFPLRAAGDNREFAGEQRQTLFPGWSLIKRYFFGKTNATSETPGESESSPRHGTIPLEKDETGAWRSR